MRTWVISSDNTLLKNASVFIVGEGDVYKHGSSDNPNSAQRFISQEAAFKTTQRVLTQGLSLMSSLSGA
ncbi:hypothetical protein ACSLPA_33245, partial [Escherichia coli]